MLLLKAKEIIDGKENGRNVRIDFEFECIKITILEGGRRKDTVISIGKNEEKKFYDAFKKIADTKRSA